MVNGTTKTQVQQRLTAEEREAIAQKLGAWSEPTSAEAEAQEAITQNLRDGMEWSERLRALLTSHNEQ